jgi:competence protein ComFC
MQINTSTLLPYNTFWKIIDWFYPPVCCTCGEIGKLICDECFLQIERIHGAGCNLCGEPIRSGSICARCEQQKPHFSKLRSFGYYSGPLRDAIVSLKYQRNIGLGEFFAPLLIEIIIQEKWTLDGITAIPLSTIRKKERGYNQAELLARPIARALKLPYENKIISRKKHTASQVGLSVKERQLNMQDAFEGNPRFVKGKSFLLIDDVATTGATMDACAKALLDAGSRRIYGLTLAKTIGLQDDLFGTKNSILRR